MKDNDTRAVSPCQESRTVNRNEVIEKKLIP